ncbi:MAG: transcription termination factor Rho [Planctomycetes bacterium]|nr:transcription termination factor Rho [Planctomycetota bacterium]
MGQPRQDRGFDPRHQGLDPRLLAAGELSLAPTSGVLEIQNDGNGYLRRLAFNYSIRPDDVLVPAALIRQHRLQEGMAIEGKGAVIGRRPQNTLLEVQLIDGLPPDAPPLANRPVFKDLTSLDPIEKFDLSRNNKDPSIRIIDLLTPIGKGQRGLIVAPPRTGKTILLQRLAHAITVNHPEVHLIVLLVDERPEEATDWKRSVQRGEVLSSTSDEMAANHVNIAEIAIERAKRLVELKKDVVILFDSLTRLARAYNNETKNSGRTLSGGVDARTLEKPKAFFGAARKAEEGGSLTILATALIETGSRMDQVIFEEFKGTGNMELVLSRKLADMRIFPAIDFNLSGTRKEEKLLPENQLQSVWALRRVLQKVEVVEGMKILIKKLGETETNAQFLGSFRAVD